MSSPISIRNHSQERSSVDFIRKLPSSSTVMLTKNQLKTTTPNSISVNLNVGQQIGRLSSVSSSYALFLKQRDMDKVKRIVSVLDSNIF